MVLVDTSSWIEFIRKNGKPEVQERVRSLLINNQTVWCEMVILELWNCASGAADMKQLRFWRKLL